MPTREEVYRAIDTERVYQEDLNDRKLTTGEEIAVLIQYVNKALNDWNEDFSEGDDQSLPQIRKVAAIAIRCMENHGAPERGSVDGQAIASRKLQGWQ